MAKAQVVREFKLRTGSVYIPFQENEEISWQNMLAGRPFDEGWLPSRHIPDPRGWPELITYKIVDADGDQFRKAAAILDAVAVPGGGMAATEDGIIGGTGGEPLV